MTTPASNPSHDEIGSQADGAAGSGRTGSTPSDTRPLGERSARLAAERRGRRARRNVLPSSHRESFVECSALVAASEASVTPRSTVASRSAGVLVARASASSASAIAGSGRAAKRVGGVAKKITLVAAVVGFAASGVLPLLSTAGDQAQAVAIGGSAVTTAGSQSLSVADTVSAAADDTARDAYSATSMIDLATQTMQNSKAAASTTYSGPSTADYLANPIYPELDRDQVLAVALQYIGTPYVHGGEDPSKFDCSGLITFVYAQFGIELTHYVPTQNTEGTIIPESEAVPGDLVVFDNLAHDGIYAGNGMILDAPKPGGFVDVRPIWNQAHHFVRIAG